MLFSSSGRKKKPQTFTPSLRGAPCVPRARPAAAGRRCVLPRACRSATRRPRPFSSVLPLPLCSPPPPRAPAAASIPMETPAAGPPWAERAVREGTKRGGRGGSAGKEGGIRGEEAQANPAEERGDGAGKVEGRWERTGAGATGAGLCAWPEAQEKRPERPLARPQAARPAGRPLPSGASEACTDPAGEAWLGPVRETPELAERVSWAGVEGTWAAISSCWKEKRAESKTWEQQRWHRGEYVRLSDKSK